MSLQLEDTIVGRVEFTEGGLRCVKGAIEEPIQCPYPVFYKARFCPQSDGIVRIDGIAGFDAEYERTHFTWNWNPALNQLIIADWTREQMVPREVFDKYKTYVSSVYKDNLNFTAPIRTDNIHAFPYYRYPRTKDGPLIPELVEHVIGNIPSILFVQHEDDTAN